MEQKKTSKPVWRKPAPKSAERTTLSPEDKQAAKTRAAKAGRPYPNLIDNMWAAKRAKARKG